MTEVEKVAKAIAISMDHEEVMHPELDEEMGDGEI